MSKATIDLEKDKFNAQGEVKVAGAFEGGRKTDYSSADVTTLSSSTDVNKWLGAYNDGVLKKEFVESFDYSNKGIAYYTHPGLGDGNKCLRIFCLYTGTPPNRVLTAKFANVVNWSYDSSLQGVLALTLGSITSPGVSSTTGTDVCTVSFTDTGTAGTYSLALSGTNAASYQLNNTTQGQTGSTITNVLKTDTVVIETASNFGGITYSHSATCTLTDTNTSRTTTQNFSTTGTAITADNEFALISQVTNTTTDTDFEINGTEKSLWPSHGSGSNTFMDDSEAWSLAFWVYVPTATRSNTFRTCLIKQQVGAAQGGIQVFMRGVVDIELYVTSTTANNYIYAGSNDINYDAWNHVIFTYDGSGTFEAYVDAGSAGSNGGTYPTAINNATVNNLMLHTFVHTPGGGAAKHRANDNCRLDELIAFNIELSASQRTELYNSGGWIDPSTLSFSGNIDSYFKMGDGSNDDVANNKAYDEEDNSRYFEKVGTGTHKITQLTMNDVVYSSGSGNHKYVQSPSIHTLSGGDSGGSSMPTGRIGAYQNIDASKRLFGSASSSAAVSVSLWYNQSASPGYAHALVSAFLINSSNTTLSAKWQLTADSNDIFYHTNTGVSAAYQSAGSAISDNTWRHLVLTIEEDPSTSSDYLPKIYIDGVLKSLTTGGGFAKTNIPYIFDTTGYTNYGFAINGNYVTGTGHTASGTANTNNMRIDELSTYNIALSQSQVTAIYNNGSPTDLTGHTGIEHWFRMGDGANDTGTSIACVFHPSTTMTSTQDYRQNH